MAWNNASGGDSQSSTEDDLDSTKPDDNYFAQPHLPVGKKSIDPTRKVKIGGPPKRSMGLGKRKSTTKPRGMSSGKQTTKANELKGA